MGVREDGAVVAEQIKDDYECVRVLDDGSVIALGRLITTWAIYMDCCSVGWGRRFCFNSRVQAIDQFMKLRTEDDEPVGWNARRG